jgi:hypothetical protein
MIGEPVQEAASKLNADPGPRPQPKPTVGAHRLLMMKRASSPCQIKVV